MQQARESGYDSTVFRQHAEALADGLATVNQILAEVTALTNTREFLRAWMIVMLVTFAEAYLEDALSLLISTGFNRSFLPDPIADEITKKWIKNLIRGGNPHEWIKKLEKLGATGYEPDLSIKMQKIWARRHALAHTAEPEIKKTASQEFIDAVLVIKVFAEVTDTLVVAYSTQTVTPPSP